MGNGLDISGFEELNDAFARLKDVPEGVMEESLEAMAKTALPLIKAKGESMGVRDPESNVHILDTLKATKFVKTKNGGHIDLNFSGTRTRSGKKTRNAEIAFVNEYGKRSQAARPFIGTALAENEDKIANAGIKVLSDWIEKTFEK